MKISRLEYTCPNSSQDFQQMANLQKKNLPSNISKEEAIEQGFVTVNHSVELLESMNKLGSHAIAKDGDRVVGYTLFMSKDLEATIPILVLMFEQLKKVKLNHSTIYDSNYFVMGQVCINKDYRGQGVFDGLYQFLKEKNKEKYNYIVTEVATRNARSMRAHKRVGFRLANIYESEIGEEWAIIVWDLRG